MMSTGGSQTEEGSCAADAIETKERDVLRFRATTLTITSTQSTTVNFVSRTCRLYLFDCHFLVLLCSSLNMPTDHTELGTHR